MGYSTEFSGSLAFTSALDVEQLRALNKMLGEDRRDHPEWNLPGGTEWHYLDLEVTDDLDGLKWNGSEKSYGMVEQVNFILAKMRETWPTFGLSGAMKAQGEDGDDRWELVMSEDSRRAHKIASKLAGAKTKCPECRHVYRVMPDGTVAE